MTRAHTPNIAVLAVVLAVLTVAVAPMAVAASSGDSTSGTTIGDQLSDAGGSSDDSSDDSTDGGDSSGDGSTTDSDDSSTDDGGTSDSSGDTDADSGDDSTTSDSDDTSSDTSTDGSTDDAQEPLETVTTNVSEVTDDVALPDDVTGDLSSSTDVADVGGERTDGTETTNVVTTNPKLDAILLETDTLDGTSVPSTTTDVTNTVDEDSDALVEETTFVLGAIGTSSAVDTTSTAQVGTRLESVPAASQSFAAPRSNTLVIGGAAATGSTPLPPAPATGLALGAGALAAAAVTRNGAAAPTLLATLGASLGSTVTAGLAPIAGRAGVFDRLFRMLAPFRYSRYDDSDPLEHDARSDVYDVVNEAPGAYLSEVAEEADLPLSTARHHIRVLEREDLVSGAKVRGKRRFYPAYTQGIELAAALNDEATAAVIDAVARFGAASVSDLANELGRDPSTVSHHLKRLAEDDIVVRERDGRAVMNKLSAEARTALDPGRDTPATEAGEALASD